VNFTGFEAWWKSQSGATDPDIPVLPEFMVMKIEDKVRSEAMWRSTVSKGSPTATADSEQSERWRNLQSKLRTLVGMQRQWGDLHEIYETRAESLFEQAPLPKWVRDPDSDFSAVWDLTSVVLLLYVAVSVPLRACFDIDVDLWTFAFWFDACVDIYFIVDVVLNFRTSFFDENGFREERPGKMARYYLKRWFTIDFISCLPFGYIGYFQDTDEAGSQDLRALKAFRLIRMTKLLRLARIKKILTKYGSDVNFQQYLNIGFTLFGIIFLMRASRPPAAPARFCNQLLTSSALAARRYAGMLLLLDRDGGGNAAQWRPGGRLGRLAGGLVYPAVDQRDRCGRAARVLDRQRCAEDEPADRDGPSVRHLALLRAQRPRERGDLRRAPLRRAGRAHPRYDPRPRGQPHDDHLDVDGLE